MSGLNISMGEGGSAGKAPVVSVIVAAYNCQEFVGECIRSLVGQTFADFEAIVVDDASTDNTMATAQHAAEGDARFRFIDLPANGGPGAARNAALDRARGEYVMYVDSDDRLVADALEKLVSRAKAQNLDELYFSAQSFYEDNEVAGVLNEDFSGREPFEGVATGTGLFTFFSDRGQYFPQGALRMARRSLIEEHGIRFPEGIIHEDVLFGFRILTASARSSFLNEPLYLRRQRAGSIMGASRRSADNVLGHAVTLCFIRSWVHEHAEVLDDAFLRAIGRECGTWASYIAHDWNEDLTDAERVTISAALKPDERTNFFFEMLGFGEATERAAAEWRDSQTYRLGDALARGPRAAKVRFSALVDKAKARKM